MLRVLGIMLLIIGLTTFILLIVLSSLGFTTHVAVRGAPYVLMPKPSVIITGDKIVIVQVSGPLSFSVIEGYKYYAYARLYSPLVAGHTNTKSTAFLLRKRVYDSYVRSLIPLLEAGEAELADLLRMLELRSLDHGTMRASPHGGLSSERLDTKGHTELVVVVVVEVEDLNASLPLLNGTVVTINRTTIYTLGPRFVSQVPLGLDVDVVAELSPTLDQYFRSLDLALLGATVVAVEVVAKRAARRRRAKSYT